MIDFKIDEQVKTYLEELDNGFRHSGYEKATEHAKEMRVHILGETPKEKLETYRPNEPKEVQEYRVKIYEPETKGFSKKVLNTISKVTKNSNYSIDHIQEPDSSIPEGETLQKYTEKEYPIYKNLLDYIFKKLFKNDMYDPNAIAVIEPLYQTNEPTELYKPVCKVYRSDQLYDYTYGEHYTILLDERSKYKQGSAEKEGNIYKVITKDSIYRMIQTGEEAGKAIYTIEVDYEIPFNETPVFFLGGEDCSEYNYYLLESFMSGMLPYWNKCINISSDLDAQFVQHMYLERVELETECDQQGCTYSSEKGYYGLIKDDGSCTRCRRCDGTGWKNGRSPYGSTKIREKSTLDGNNNQIFPGVEYINKDTSIVKTCMEYIQYKKDEGFSSLNMDFLSTVGLSQSGIAKSTDRNEFNDFLSTISDNLFDNIIYHSYYYINQWRYYILFNGDKEKLNDNMPSINKPTTFDTANVMQIGQEISELTTAGVSKEIIGYMSKNLADKKFANDFEIKNIVQSVLDLDPLPNMSEDNKMVILGNRGTTEINYIISCNIKPFILRAWEEKGNDFFEMKLLDKIDLLKGYAKEMQKETSSIEISDSNGNTSQV